ncbi:MAG: Holliday junction resolvase RuvX [Oscillospiraceae bacterium]|nr:Holliday junction resolvase RuvX [Oscillospiraceae bacterium]
MKILGIDLGKARTGVAVSDENEKLAFPLTTLKERSDEELLFKILGIIERLNIKKIVVGLPKNMNATEGASAKKARSFGKAIENKTDAKVVMQDERMTTIIAHKYLDSVNLVTKKRRNIVDSVAATVILQSFLDAKTNV